MKLYRTIAFNININFSTDSIGDLVIIVINDFLVNQEWKYINITLKN